MKAQTQMAGLLALFLFASGCASFETGAYRTISSITTTVEAARKGWVDYVTTQRVVLSARPLEANKLEVQVGQVGDAYAKYQTSMRAAKAAVLAYKAAPVDQKPVETALNAVSAAGAEVVKLVNQFSQ